MQNVNVEHFLITYLNYINENALFSYLYSDIKSVIKNKIILLFSISTKLTIFQTNSKPLGYKLKQKLFKLFGYSMKKTII